MFISYSRKRLFDFLEMRELNLWRAFNLAMSKILLFGLTTMNRTMYGVNGIETQIILFRRINSQI